MSPLESTEQKLENVKTQKYKLNRSHSPLKTYSAVYPDRCMSGQVVFLDSWLNQQFEEVYKQYFINRLRLMLCNFLMMVSAI